MDSRAPKYLCIAEDIRQQIESGQIACGEKLETEAVLCGRFGVSRQTVRAAMKTLQDAGVIRRQQGSGSYALGVPPAPRHTGRIGVLSTYLDDYIFPGIIRGMQETLMDAGFAIELASTRNRVEHERQWLLRFLKSPVDGLIVEPTKSGLPSPNLPLYAQLAAQGVPVVFFNARYPGSDAPYVALDDEAAGRVATAHLLALGHRRIAGFFKSDDVQGPLRYAGYARALTAQGAPLDAGRTLWFASEDIPALFEDTGRVLARLEGATAVFCYNDEIALSLLRFLKARGIRVPEDLSVIGVDDSPQAACGSPALTSIHHPKERLGAQAAGILLALLQGRTASPVCLLAAEVISRETTAPPKAIRA